MILPTTYITALLLTILTMLCWGSWANTFKLSGKWRFELFYYDYSLGVLVTALLIAFTFGAMGSDLSFLDNFMIAGKMKIVDGLAAGLVFNLANILLVAAISVAGMAVAFPVGIGIALIVGVVWNYALNPQGNPLFLFSGVALVMIAIVLDAMAYAFHSRTHKPPVDEFPVPTPPRPGVRRPVVQPVNRGATPMKGILLSVVSGILMGSFYPLVEMGKSGENGLGPYAIGVVFAVGVFLSTFVYNIYFLNLPVQGPSIEMWQYFRGTPRQHLLGILGGAIWAVGAISNFVAASAPNQVQVGPAVSYALGQGATLVSALWGLLVWREFAGADPGVKRLLAAMLLFFIGGLTLCSLAPLYAAR